MGALRPLERGYTREPAVAAEIEELRALPADRFWRRVEADHADCAARPETLVYFVRELHVEGRREDAWRIASQLSRRAARTVESVLARTAGLTPVHRCELAERLGAEFYEQWFSLEPEQAFWEVRFGLCVRRKLNDAIDAHRRAVGREVSLSPTVDGEPDPLENMQDLQALDPQTAALVLSALDVLPEPQKTAFFLRHYSQWDEGAIAEQLGVTSRSVRNYLARAERRLAEWRNAE